MAVVSWTRGGGGGGGAVVTGYTRWTPEGGGPGEWQPFTTTLPPLKFRDMLLAGPLQIDPPSWTPGSLAAILTGWYVKA